MGLLWNSMKIASLRFFKEQRERLIAFPSYLRKTAAPIRRTGQWALHLQFMLDFIKLAYQQPFTPVEKGLWTKEGERCVWSCRTVSTKGILVLLKEAAEPQQNSNLRNCMPRSLGRGRFILILVTVNPPMFHSKILILFFLNRQFW